MNKISIVNAYYTNKGMLKLQFGILNGYPDPTRKLIEYVVVDDCSPQDTSAMRSIEENKLQAKFNFQLYQHLTDLRWAQDAARNLGVKKALFDWVLLTDIDHYMRAEDMTRLLAMDLDPSRYYSFQRLIHPNMEWKAPHCNSFLMTKDLFWQVGGYDEWYCGHYGTDGIFKRELKEQAKEAILDLPLVVVGRSFLPDASTHTLVRKDDWDKDLTSEITAFKKRTGQKKRVLSMPWRKII